MWIKNKDGELVNLDTGTVIKIFGGNVMLELPQRDFNDLYLTYDEEEFGGITHKWWFFHDDGGDEITFEYKFIETFKTEKEAKKYIAKLAAKLGAEEI